VRSSIANDLKTVRKVYKAENFDFDFALKPGSAAIDRGALQSGKPAPHYGPGN
jgi:hypothetical protein